MRPYLVRGGELECLPPRTSVLRAVKLNIGIGNPSQVTRYNFNDLFVLSDTDKNEKPPALSVFVEGLTTPRQAIELLTNASRYEAVARLDVDKVRAIPVHDTIAVFTASLDVLWVQARLPNGDVDTRPGANGHAGLVGLKREKGIDKNHYKSLRDALVVLARQQCHTVAEWEALTKD